MFVSHPKESKSCRNDRITDTKELHPAAILKEKKKVKEKDDGNREHRMVRCDEFHYQLSPHPKTPTPQGWLNQPSKIISESHNNGGQLKYNEWKTLGWGGLLETVQETCKMDTDNLIRQVLYSDRLILCLILFLARAGLTDYDKLDDQLPLAPSTRLKPATHQLGHLGFNRSSIIWLLTVYRRLDLGFIYQLCRFD